MNSAGRESFSGKLAPVMALVGSAVGLGNIWRFPYIMGEYGGGAFILVYIICCILVSVPIFISESIIGRKAGLSAYYAYDKLAPGTKWKIAGFITIFSSFIILSYYSVVGGWSVDYFVRSCMGALNAGTSESASRLFGGVVSSVWEPLIAHTIFFFISSAIVILGVDKGIGKFSSISTPVLFLLIVAIAVFSVTLPGASGGIRYLVEPDFSKLTQQSVAYALGQSFFSLSLGVGCVMTYSSYMNKNTSLLNTGISTAAADTLFAVIAGFAIMPAVFAAGLEPGAGPSLVFETLPYIFTKMGAGSFFLAKGTTIIFFLAILIAAITSEISMIEVCTSFLMEKFNISRRTSVLLVSACGWVIGAVSSLSFGVLSGIKIAGMSIFSFLDVLTSNFLMVIGAALVAVFVGWVMKKDEVKDELTSGGKRPLGERLFNVIYFFIRWVVPPMIVLIFISNFVY